MRIGVDPASDTLRIVLGEAAEAEVREVADGIAAAYDAAGRLVGVTISDVARVTGAAEALAELRLSLNGATPPAAAPAPTRVVPIAPMAPTPPRLLSPAEIAELGPLSWEPEAEAAMALVPFFRRGPIRRAVVARTRERGLSRVTAAIVEETQAGAR